MQTPGKRIPRTATNHTGDSSFFRRLTTPTLETESVSNYAVKTLKVKLSVTIISCGVSRV
jgi:ABC-type branched-subunit amino acid transport system substrate-binding protein